MIIIQVITNQYLTKLSFVNLGAASVEVCEFKESYADVQENPGGEGQRNHIIDYSNPKAQVSLKARILYISIKKGSLK